MIMHLYNFSKKKNSTAQPLPTDATIFSNVQLKDTTSMLNPVIILNPTSQGMAPFTPTKFNYALLPLFGRYYY